MDPPPLRILRFSPSDQAVNIAASAALQVVFDQAVDPATIIFTGAGATLSASEVTATLLRSPATSPQTLPAVAAAASALSADKLTATFVPAVPAGATTAFGASSTVTFSAAGTIQSGIATSKGGQLQLSPGGSAVTAAFRIQDPSPLAVGGTEPNGDPGANASATSDILVSFSRDVFCGTSAAGTGFFASPQSALLVTDCGATQPSVGVDCSTTGTQIPVKAITCSPGAGGLPSTVRFTPLAAMTPNDWIQVKLGDVALKNGQVAANDATIVNGTVYGQLGAAPFTFQFKVGLEPLQILSTIPPQFANTTTSPTLTLHTNFGVDPSTLKQCTAFASGAATPAGCNYFLTTKLTSGVPDVTGGLYASALTAGLSNGDLAITTSTPLANNATYGLYLCATSSSTTCTSAPNPIRAQGVNAVLLSNFQLIFTTGSAIVSVVRVANGAQAANTSGALTVPAFPSPATGVSVDPASPMVCATFVGALSASTWSASHVSVSFTPDVFGQTINVPLTNFTAAGNVGCFDFDVTAIDDALGGKRQLLYNTKFNGSIGTGVVASGTSGLTPFQFAFKTQGAPSILGSFATNSVVNTSRILHGEADMPFTPNLFVLFGNGANPSAYPGLLASSLTSTSVQLLQGATSVAITAQVAPGNPNALQVTPNAPLSPLTTYTLVLQGGAGGISDVNGNFLESTTRYTFVTSPQTTAVISPAETAIDSEIQIPFIFSRNLYLPSATNAAISATVGGKAAQGVIAENASTPRTVTFIASPTWPNNTVTPIIVSSNGAVLDERGNAVAPVTRSWTGTGNLSAITSKAPTAPTAASVAAVCPSPTTPGATVDCGTFGTPAIPTAVFGDQAFRITFGGTGLQQRILPSSVSSASVSLAPTAPEPVTCTLPSGQATGQPIPLRFTFAAGSSLTADAVIVSARDPRLNPAHRLASGCLYALTVDPAKIANLYGVAGAAGSAFQISLLGGVGTPAGTGSVTTSSGTQATLGSSTTTQVAGNTTVTMTFAAQAQSGTQVGADIDPATVNASTVPVTASTGASPAGTYAVEGNVVTFTLAGPPNWFSTGVTYTAAVTAGVKDFAGHAAAASSAAFTTSSTVPTVVSGSVAYVTVSSGAAAGLVNGAFVAKLSEGVRPETLTPSTATPAFTGAFDVKCGGATIYGALGVDLADPTRIVFQPAYHTVSGGASCTVTLSTGVKDYEGVGIASPSATTLTVPSTP